MLSLITPTHNPKHLRELWRSIQAQTYTGEYEWIVVPNHGGFVFHDLTLDPRVRIIQAPDELEGVGALKRFAFEQAYGDILVEVDHDDVLLPECLSEVSAAFEDSSVGFVYSDSANLGGERFSPDYGWEFHDDFEYNGKVVWSAKAFEPDAASLSSVWYAPDHVRAWRAKDYQLIGGHCADLKVCDDHELLIRTYLRSMMKHIPKPLYVYRVHQGNTYLRDNATIQSVTRQLYGQYIVELAERQAKLEGKKVRSLREIHEENGLSCWGVELSGVNSVGVLHANDYLHSLTQPDWIMRCIWDYLSDGGWMFVTVPSTDGRGAFQDPSNTRSYWNENKFWYWTEPEIAKYIGNTECRFQSFRLDTTFPTQWHHDHNIPYTTAHLRSIKSSARRPGVNPWRSIPLEKTTI